MIYQIENDNLIAKIDSLGAQLVSLIEKKSGVECIWQGDAKYWQGHAPILFPFIGRLYQQQYFYHGQIYKMRKHGFARDKEFKIVQKESDKITLIQNSDVESLQIYPFVFSLQISFKLENNRLIFTADIMNNDHKIMYFAFGGHPAFNVPFMGDKFEDYYLEFKHSQYQQKILSPDGLFSTETKPFYLNDNKLPLKHSLFDNDAICLNSQDDEIMIRKRNSDSYIKMMYKNMTSFGIWHTNLTDAPFVCLEPWAGFPGRSGVVEDLETLNEIQKVKPQQTSSFGFTLEVSLQ